MNHRFWASLTAGLLFFAVGGAAKPSAKADRSISKLPSVAAKKWTGDLDGMIKRRYIRALVPYSKTLYFIDRAPSGAWLMRPSGSSRMISTKR